MLVALAMFWYKKQNAYNYVRLVVGNVSEPFYGNYCDKCFVSFVVCVMGSCICLFDVLAGSRLYVLGVSSS
jgi:hypothetical protein